MSASVVAILLSISAADPVRWNVPLGPILEGEVGSELAPHGEGNVYAPDVHVEGSRYRMWYGGQGRDGHDRIHLAESDDGNRWARKGVVLEDLTANHVNDPSIVRVGDKYFMYYTRAVRGVIDEIALATSTGGVRWGRKGVVLRPGAPGEWDSLYPTGDMPESWPGSLKSDRRGTFKTCRDRGSRRGVRTPFCG
jgi:hypothetical protein